ncbi:MAG TPA: dienelactone hydrolase family protein [Steroidobacteraceae bacterium]|nr:dienelactone hydrolase family protein [Steroidobacteraceae bacterium]
MSEFTTLMARDGHEFSAWLAAPAAKPRGAVVVIQEIFGVNAHIRAVADGYAAEGYVAIAPALFDRVRRGVELGYTPETMKEGFGYVQQLQREKTLLDLAACIAVVKHAGRTGVVGFCWGGRMAYVAACELTLACGVAYYGGGIAQELGRVPKCPMLYHFGGLDTHIPQSDVDKIRAVDTRGTFHVYPDAEHGFNCDMRGSFNPAAAQLARQRTLAFLAHNLRGEAAATGA